MVSALAFHGLTDQMPRRIWMAIGKSDWAPVQSYPPLRIVRFTEPYLRTGVEQHAIAGLDVPVYSIPKTLADLFRNLEHSEQTAVTPTMDLAKLALVTTQDEEEDDQGGAGTDASNDTDATLVEDGPVRAPERSSPSPIRSPKSPSSPTVLGKRNRGRTSDVNMEGITTSEAETDYVVVSKSKSPSPSCENERPKPERKGSSSKRKATTEQDGVVVKDVQERKAPPLPPRKPATTNDSIMMFGQCKSWIVCLARSLQLCRPPTRRLGVHGQLHVPNRNSITGF